MCFPFVVSTSTKGISMGMTLPQANKLAELVDLMQKRLDKVSKATGYAGSKINAFKTKAEEIKDKVKKLKSSGKEYDLPIRETDEIIRKFEQAEHEALVDGDYDVVQKLNHEDEHLDDKMVKLAEEIDDCSVAAMVSASFDILGRAIELGGGSFEVVGFQKKTATQRLIARKKRLKYMRTASGRAAMRRAKIAADRRRRMHKRPNAQRSRLMKQVHRSYGY